jgi:hypothetical protein
MKNNVKKFNQFVNEVYGLYNADMVKRAAFRKKLVGGKGQKAGYDALDSVEKYAIENAFASLQERNPELAMAFVRKLSKFNSIEELQQYLQDLNLRDWDRAHGRGKDEEPGRSLR